MTDDDATDQINDSEHQSIIVEFPLGWIELKTEYRTDGDAIVCYGYSVTKDKNGIEISRTRPEAISRITVSK